MSNASARPENLRSFVSTATPVASRLDEDRIRLTGSYHTFLENSADAAARNPDLLSRALPELVQEQYDAITFTDLVATAFETADAGAVDGGKVTVAEAALATHLQSVATANGIDLHAVAAVDVDTTIDPTTAGYIPRDSGFVVDPICTATGHFLETEHDLVLPGRLELLAWQRTYSSRGAHVGGHGTGWVSWADVTLRRDDVGGLRYRGPDGQQLGFDLDTETGAWTIDPALGLSIERHGDDLVLEWSATTPFASQRWTFRNGHPTEVWGPLTGTTTFEHEDGRLVELHHEGGRTLRLEWAMFTDDVARISALHCSDGRQVRYRYDEAAELVAVERATGGNTYTIGEDGRIEAIHDADGVRLCHNTYDARGRVVRQVSAAGRETVLRYEEGRRTLVADTGGGPAALYEHDEAGRLTTLVNAEGRRFARTFDDEGVVATQRHLDGSTLERVDPAPDAPSPNGSFDPTAATTVVGSDGSTQRWFHDDRGRLERMEEGSGRWVHYRYEGASTLPSRVEGPEGWRIDLVWDRGAVVSVTDADGVRTEMDVDDDGCVVASRDGLGHETRFVPLRSGRTGRIVHPDGAETVLDHDDAGRLLAVTDGEGNQGRFEYSPAGRLVAFVDPAGARTTLTWGSDGLPSTITNPLGDEVQLQHDSCARLVAMLNVDQTKWRYEYGLVGQLTMVEAPDGGLWSLSHDANGHLVGTVDPAGGETVLGRDGMGQVTELLDAAGHRTRWSYDAAGNPVEVHDAAGGLATMVWDLARRLTTATDPDGVTTATTYTPGGRVATVTLADGRTLVHDYDAAGRLVSVTDGRGAAWTYEWSERGFLVAATDPTGATARTTRDRAGRVVATTTGRATWRYTYDEGGRVATSTDPTGGTTRHEYDALGRVVAVTDPLGATTRYRYDAAGHLVETIDALGGSTTVVNDALGRPVAWTDPLGRTTRVTRDALGRPSTTVLPDGRTVAEVRDAVGNVVAVRIDGDDVARYRHDGVGRTVEAVEPATGRTTELAWTAGGRPAGWRQGRETLAWSYDDAGRLVERAVDGEVDRRWQHGATTTLSTPWGDVHTVRDARGLVTSLTAPGLEQTWERDVAGRITATTRVLDGRTETTRLTRDDAGRVVAAETPDGVSRFAYDGAGQLIAADTPAGSWAGAYDAAGRLVLERLDGDERHLTYDAADQLVALESPTGTRDLRYDDAGRRTAESGDGAPVSYDWDARGRLRRVDVDGRSLALDIDALGQLRAVDGTALRWDPSSGIDDLVAIDGSPVVALDGLARAVVGDDGALRWARTDWRGADPDRDPWGAGGDPAAHGAHLGFLGEVGVDHLLWLRARAYDPRTRRFLSPDPLPGTPGRPVVDDPYHYAGNDPLGFVDPTGREPVSIEDFENLRAAATGTQWGNIAAVGVAVVAVAVVVVCPLSVGAVIAVGASAGAVSGAAPGLSDGLVHGHWDWGGIARGAVIGGAMGAAGGAIGGASTGAAGATFARTVGGEALIGAATPIATYGYNHTPLPGADPRDTLTVGEVLQGGAIGAGTGALGYGAGQGYARLTTPVDLPPAPVPPPAPAPPTLHVPPPPTLATPLPPPGFAPTPSGLLVPSGPTLVTPPPPAGMVQTPSGLLVPG